MLLMICWQKVAALIYNLFGGHENSKKRCWHMHFNNSSLVPHPEGTIVC